MTVGEIIRCRVRFFTDGAVIGSREFIVEQRDGPQGENNRTKRRRVNSIRQLEKGAAIFCLRHLEVDGISSNPTADREQKGVGMEFLTDF